MGAAGRVMASSPSCRLPLSTGNRRGRPGSSHQGNTISAQDIRSVAVDVAFAGADLEAALAALFVVLALVNGWIAGKEKHLKEGRILYRELAPVDPRSLMQGDYMDLNYQVANQIYDALSKTSESRRWRQDVVASDGHVVLGLDPQNVGSPAIFEIRNVPASPQLPVGRRTGDQGSDAGAGSRGAAGGDLKTGLADGPGARPGPELGKGPAFEELHVGDQNRIEFGRPDIGIGERGGGGFAHQLG